MIVLFGGGDFKRKESIEFMTKAIHNSDNSSARVAFFIPQRDPPGEILSLWCALMRRQLLFC